jgi:hypothetical protein
MHICDGCGGAGVEKVPRYSRFMNVLVLKANSNCGANGPGGGGFQPGNDCAAEPGGAAGSTAGEKKFAHDTPIGNLKHDPTKADRREFVKYVKDVATLKIRKDSLLAEAVKRALSDPTAGDRAKLMTMAGNALTLNLGVKTAARAVIDNVSFNPASGDLAQITRGVRRVADLTIGNLLRLLALPFRRRTRSATVTKSMQQPEESGIVIDDVVDAAIAKAGDNPTPKKLQQAILEAVEAVLQDGGEHPEEDDSEETAESVLKSVFASMLFGKASDCGANADGGGGFQPGNKCGGKGDAGSTAGGGPGKQKPGSGSTGKLTPDDATVYAKHKDKVVALATTMLKFTHGKAGPEEVKALKDELAQTGAGDTLHRIAQAVVDKQMEKWAAAESEQYRARQTASPEHVQAIAQKLQRFSPAVSDEFLKAQSTAVLSILNSMPAQHAATIADNVRSVTIAADTEEVGLALAMETLDTQKAAAGGWVGQTGVLVLDGVDKYHEIAKARGTTTDRENVVDTLQGLAAHEMAHALDTGKRISNSIEWTDAWVTEIDQTKKASVPKRTSQGYTLSAYAAKTKSEGWAEYVRLVHEDPDKAIRHFPKCWAVYKASYFQEQATQPVTKSATTEQRPDAAGSRPGIPRNPREDSGKQRELFGEPIENPGSEFPIDTWLTSTLTEGIETPSSLVYPDKKKKPDARVSKAFADLLFAKASNCGANGPGGQGFQPSNTCAKEDGEAAPKQAEASGPILVVKPVLQDDENPQIGPKRVPQEAVDAVDKLNEIAKTKDPENLEKLNALVAQWKQQVPQTGLYSNEAKKLSREISNLTLKVGDDDEKELRDARTAARREFNEIEEQWMNLERDIKARGLKEAVGRMKRGTKPHEVQQDVWLMKKITEDAEKAVKLRDWMGRVVRTAEHLDQISMHGSSDVEASERLDGDFKTQQELYDWTLKQKETKQIWKWLKTNWRGDMDLPKVAPESNYEAMQHIYTMQARSSSLAKDLASMRDNAELYGDHMNQYRETWRAGITKAVEDGLDIDDGVMGYETYSEWFVPYREKYLQKQAQKEKQQYIQSDSVKAVAEDVKKRLDKARGEASQIIASILKAVEPYEQAHAEATKAFDEAFSKAWIIRDEYYTASKNRPEGLSVWDWERLPETAELMKRKNEAEEAERYAEMTQDARREDVSRAVTKYVYLPQERRSEITIKSVANSENALLGSTRYSLDSVAYFLSGIIDKSVLAKMEMKAEPLPNGRTRANASGDTMRLRPDKEADWVIAHEAGHILEAANENELAKMSTGFLAMQIGDEKVEHLNKLIGADVYDSHEAGVKDGFMDAYTGKVYEHGATEILSMGIQYLHQGRIDFFRQSPEHALYTIAAIRGLLTEAKEPPKPEPPQPAGPKKQRELFSKAGRGSVGGSRF